MSGASLLAMAVAGGVAVLLLSALTVRRLRSRRRRRLPRASLARLDYLPPVTSRAPRLRWQGSRYWTIGDVTTPPVPAEKERELVGVRATARRGHDAGNSTGAVG